MMRTQTPKYARANCYTPLFRVVHPGIAAIVYSALGQACSIVVRGLRQYSTFNSAEVQYRAYSLQ